MLRATQAGASAFVPKNGSLPEMLDVLRRARNGGMLVAASAFGSTTTAPQPTISTPRVELTQRERDVLHCLNRGMAPKAIAQVLGISLHTCRGYVKPRPGRPAGRTGTVIYADDVAEIGERLPIPAEAAAAIDTGTVTSDVTTEPEAGPIPGDDQFVEVYAPLRLPGQAPLAFEIYLSYDRVETTANNLVLRIVPLAVGALLLLQLIQTPITVSLARRVAGHEAERAALLERALSASERERRQIAEDLHDGVVQDLAGAGYALAAVARRVDGSASTGVEHVGRVVRGAVESLRRLMVDIYPPDLSGAGLPGAIDDLATPLRESGVTVHVRATQLPGASSEVAAVLYRVARETLANVAKHAQASTVEIDLGRDRASPTPAVVLRVARCAPCARPRTAGSARPRAATTAADRHPGVGDIVVVHDPLGDDLIVKRVVAVGGDSIGFEDGVLVRNGRVVGRLLPLPGRL